MSGVAAKLIEECKSRGISLRPGEGGKLKVSPPPERLPSDLVAELKQHKAEVFPLVVAMTWLRSRLTTTQHIAPILAEWLGTIDRPTGRSLDVLMDARWALGVDAYIGDDGRLWWRLPQRTMQ
jgi:hypothetical protein